MSSYQQKRKSSDQSGGGQKKRRSGDAQGSGGGASGSGQGGSQGGGQGGGQGRGQGGGRGRGRGSGRGTGARAIPRAARVNTDTEYPQEAAHDIVVREVGDCPVLCSVRPRDLRLNIQAHVYADDVGHQPLQFVPNAEYNVRIPSLIHIRSNAQNVVNELKRYMREVARPQSGIHLFTRFRGNNDDEVSTFVNTLQTHWGLTADNNRRYVSYLSSHILNSVYPCYRNQPNAPAGAPLEMVTGLCFYPHRAREAVRSFGYYALQDLQNPWVSDLYESFLVEGQEFNYTNPMFEDSTAFYVCPGARLVVVDNRFIIGDNTQPDLDDYNQDGYNHSLFQQGSFVVIRGVGCYGLHVKQVNQQGHKEFYKTPMLQFFGLNTRPRGQPPDCCVIDYPLDDVERRYEPQGSPTFLRTHTKKVVFLGASESQFNSVCWQIKVNQEGDVQNTGAGAEHWFEVTAPEGGIIEDVTTWETGFRLMRHRHCYEMSWNAVVRTNNAHPMPFAVPPPDDNHYMLRRLLGIIPDPMRRDTHNIPNGKWNSAAIDINYGGEPLFIPNHFLTHQANNDIDIRRYITSNFVFRDNPAIRSQYHLQFFDAQKAINYAGYIGPHNTRAPPIRPTLYPPIFKDNQLFFLKDTKVTWKQREEQGKVVDLTNADIWQERFKITGKAGTFKLQKMVLDHSWWSHKIIDFEFNLYKPPEDDNHIWERIGSDYLNYRKFMTTPEPVSLKTLVLVQDTQ